MHVRAAASPCGFTRRSSLGSRSSALLALGALQCSCDGSQSALAPAGPAAERLASLFWLMVAGTAIVWFAVVALAMYAGYVNQKPRGLRFARRLVVWGGVVFPVVVLTALLVHGLRMIPELLAAPPPGAFKVLVIGEQWWWRVRYLPAGAPPIELANEIRLPVDTPVEFLLESPDVIHSFWIPALGGKMDMIPGRQNRLTLQATKTGILRGACAEYCGTSHAWMGFPVVVEEPREFERWLARQAEPAAVSHSEAAVRGQRVFYASGCGACHAVRGTEADGRVGPDLTHVGSRLSLGAALLENDASAFRRWIADPDRLKPSVHMPAFGVLPDEELDALAAYLESLK